MKPEHKKYIDENFHTQSITHIAKKLGLREEKVRKYVLGKKAEDRTSPPKTNGRAHGTGLFLVLLVLAICAVYINVLGGPFLFDDKILIQNNPLTRSLANIPGFFKTDIFAHDLTSRPMSSSYRPLQVITYAIDYSLWDNNPKGFHFTNIVLHLLNAIMVFFLIRRITDDIFVSFFVSLLFGIHPVNTQCVSYIAGRADVLVVAFMLLSIICYIDYCRLGTRYVLACSGIGYLLALYSKESSLFVVPFILFTYTMIFNRKNLLKPSSYVVYLASLAIYLPMRLYALRGVMAQDFELARIDIVSRVMTSLKTLFIDLRIMCAPYDLHFGRTTELEHSIVSSPYSILTVLGIAIIGYGTRRAYRKWAIAQNTRAGICAFGILWFFVSMIPFLNLVPLQVFFSENWLYFPSVGIYLAVGTAVRSQWQLSEGRFTLWKWILTVVLCGWFSYYGFTTAARNRDYCNEIKFYLSSVRWRPTVKFYRVLGGLYGERNDYAMAVKYLEKAVETNDIYPSPEVAAAYYNLGITYMKLSDLKKAEEAFGKVMISHNEALKREAERNLQYIRKRR